MMVLSTSASSGLTSRSRSASVLDGAICSSGTSSPVAGSRYWTRLWWVSSVSSSMRMPVARRTSTVAQVQNARSSSWMRSRRLPARRLAGPDPGGDAACVAEAGQGLPGGGEGLARDVPRAAARQRGGVLAPLVGGADQDRQHGQAFAGAGVHPGLAVPFGLAPADLLGADRAGRRPGPQRAGSSTAHCGEVEVEGPDRWSGTVEVVEPFTDRGRSPAGRRWLVLVLVRSRCFQAPATSAVSCRVSMPG